MQLSGLKEDIFKDGKVPSSWNLRVKDALSADDDNWSTAKVKVLPSTMFSFKIRCYFEAFLFFESSLKHA